MKLVGLRITARSGAAIPLRRDAGADIGFNTSTAHVWGQLKARWEKAGITIPSLDSQIAATAHRHSLVVFTRNLGDFKNSGIKAMNPFDEKTTDP